MKKLKTFYSLMEESVPLRRDLVSYALMDVDKPTRVEALERILAQLDPGDGSEGGALLLEDERGREVTVKPDYEVTELKKDIRFFTDGESAFLGDLESRGLGEELKELTDFLGESPYDGFITDRDGTVNNYCGRYRSSVQSAYNGLFLSRFASIVPGMRIILTSAPLMDTGIADLSVIPEDRFLLAGSKGREYRDNRGARRHKRLTVQEEQRLEELNRRLQSLLQRPENELFGQIGSSLQRKVGETTVARQDMFNSIPEQESNRFKAEVEQIIRELDGEGGGFHLEDTGRDLEIILRSEESGNHFDKGDGIAYLLGELGAQVRGEKLLICGDTASDLPMVEKAIEMGAAVTTVFVTSDVDLRGRVRETGARCTFVSEPDTLVSALNEMSKRGKG